MGLWLIVIGLLIIWPITTKVKLDGYFEDYMAQQNTLAIKGIFVMLIFASHFVGYAKLSPVALNQIYIRFRMYMGQLVVVPFLFYSGYGIAVSVEKRGDAYIKRIPSNRIRKIFLQFWLALALFFLVSILQGKSYSFKHILLAMVGWTSLGNSNWYVLMIICLYGLSYVVYRLWKTPEKVLINTFVGCFLYTLWQIAFNRPGYCYNTVFAYWFGMAFAYGKERIDSQIIQKNGNYYLTLIFSLAAFMGMHHFWKKSVIVYDLVSVLFAWFLILLSSHIQIKNRILEFMGRHVFSIYILQRLPMMILQNSLKDRPIVYFIVSFGCTVLISVCFDSVLNLKNKNKYQINRS